MDHGPAREDDSKEWELDQPIWLLGVDSVCRRQGAPIVLGVVAEEDDKRGDTAQAIEIRGRMDPALWLVVREDEVGHEAWE